MTFDPVHCWDCPTPIVTLLVTFAVSLGLLLLATLLLSQRRVAVQALGACFLAPTLLWYVSFASVGPNWGINWHPDDLNGWRRGGPFPDELMFDAWFVVSFALSALYRTMLEGRAIQNP